MKKKMKNKMTTIQEKRKERVKLFIKPSECKDEWKCNECPRYSCYYRNPNKRKGVY